jgi:hypothetical protein
MDQGNGAVWLKLAEAAPQLGLSLDGLRARSDEGRSAPGGETMGACLWP